MLVAETNQADAARNEFDVAIIGAGVVGIFAAIRLEQRGFRVALIDGGDVTPDTLSNAQFTSIVGRLHSSVQAGRAMGVGGTGLIWGGQLSEFDAADIEGGKGYWPISYAELRDLYDRVYEALDLPPRLADHEARDRFGGDEGVIEDVVRIFSYWLPNPNLAGLFREKIVSSTSLMLFARCKAVAFDFNDNTARSVLLQGREGRFAISAKTFVIAGGVVESTRLALATQLDQACPWRNNTSVGRAFQDHVGGDFGALSIQDESLFRERFETGFHARTKYMPKLRFTAPADHEGPPLSVCAFPVFHSSMSENVANIKLLLKAIRSGSAYTRWYDLPRSIVKIGSAFAPLAYRYMRSRRVLAMMDQGVTLAFQCEQVPQRESRVRLASTVPAADGLPPVALDWKISDAESRFLQTAVRHFAGYFKQSRIAHLDVQADFAGDPAVLAAKLWDTAHPGGGLCMSANSEDGATDPHGRLWGAANVYAAGASTLATSGEANITLTALALTLRLTDHLTEQSQLK